MQHLLNQSHSNQKLVDGTFTQDQFCSQHDHIRDAVGGVETVDQKVNGSSAEKTWDPRASDDHHGVNVSKTHVDFMVGSSEMNIDGIKEDGTVVPVFRNGNWA